jgi:hypothetical protein
VRGGLSVTPLPGPLRIASIMTAIRSGAAGSTTERLVLSIEPAEPVITHHRLPCARRRVDILLVQQLQRHPHPGQLGVHARPVRLRKDNLTHATAGKQRHIHLGLRQFGDVIPTETCHLRRTEDRLNAVPGYPMSRRNCSSRQALITQLQHQLALILRTVTGTPSIMCPSHGGRSFSCGAQPHQQWCSTTPVALPDDGAHPHHKRSPEKPIFSLSPQDCPSESYQSVRLRYERTHVLLLIVVVQRVRQVGVCACLLQQGAGFLR